MFDGSEKKSTARKAFRQNVMEVCCRTVNEMNSPESSFSSDLITPPGSVKGKQTN